MTAANGKTLIAVATSIPPTLVRQDLGRAADGYQALCIESWLQNGFRILSVNHPEEIPDLAARYPEIDFIPTSRNAREWTGRNNPYIADMLTALTQVNEPVLGIINSDLLFEPSSAWRERLPSLIGQSMIVANRYDTSSLLTGALRQYCGFDCFFFDKATALHALQDPAPYAMGVPWWDYWLPSMALLNNRGIVVVDRPAVLHLAHDPAYSPEIWREFARIFAKSIIREFDTPPQTRPDIITTLMPSFRAIAADAWKEPELDSLFKPFGKTFVPALRENAVRWAPGINAGPNPPSPALTGIFARFAQRLSAGQALRKARKLSAEKKLPEIGPELLAALNEAPDDNDVLLVLAEIALHRDDPETASTLLAKAVEQQPEATFPLHMLGNALRASGRYKEALACFQRILKREAKNQAAYTAAAKILWDMHQKREAIALLDQAVTDNPDFVRAAALRDHYRELAAPPGRAVMRPVLRRLKSFFVSRHYFSSSRGPVAPSVPPSPPHSET